MAGFDFRTLTEDLLTLEINTLIKADMTACKLPASRREALWSIATDYHYKLVELQCREPQVWQSAGMMSFRELRHRAGNGIKMAEQQLVLLSDENERLRSREKLTMLHRIQTQCEQLISLFVELGMRQREDFNYREEVSAIEARREAALAEEETGKVYSDRISAAWNNDLERNEMLRMPDLELNAAQIGLIRKVWEIGTERIVMQTVISVDGDITTRLAERFALDYNREVLNIHQDAVSHAVGFWSSLARIISEFAGKLFPGQSGRA